MPPSNNEVGIDSLVASVATLATAISEIQRQVKSLVKPRDSCEKSVAAPSSSALAKRQNSFTKVLSKKERRKEQAEVRRNLEVVTGHRTVEKTPTKKRRIGPVELANVNNSNSVRGSIKREEAVVSVTCAEGVSYRDALMKAREKINLKDIGVDAFKIRTGVTGSFIFKLKGAECKGKATKFAEALNKALPEAKVALPKRTGELVVCGLFPRPAMPSPISCESGTCERGPSLTGDELVVAASKIDSVRAPGLDGVPGLIVKQAVKYCTFLVQVDTYGNERYTISNFS
ncbi:hypothetical protein M0802_014089 [Mischocyttarus mexicanus]|nr:hypothetical protein M0802_014089 [Mischocyttarus mexicanus]